MSKKKTPAFSSTKTGEPGMDLRDYFAAKAMQSIIARGDITDNDHTVACLAYDIADAMLEVREVSRNG